MLNDLERRIWTAEIRTLRLEDIAESARQSGTQTMQKIAQLWTIHPEPNTNPTPPPVGAILAKYTGCLSGAGVVGATITIGTGGAVTGTTVTNGGSGYSTAPTATVNGDGASAAVAVVMSGSVTSVAITSAGRGYDAAPTVTFSAPALVGGTTATGTANMTGCGSGQTVVSVTITSGGSGYDANPTVTFSAPPARVTATGTAVLDGSGHVASVTLTNGGGQAYNLGASVSFSGGGGSGAAGTVATACGVVTGVTITNGGSGYATPPAVLFSTPSSVFAATGTTSRGSSLFVDHLTITNGGAGYSTATIAFSAGAATATTTLSSVVTLVTCTSPAPQCVVSLSFSNHGTGYTPGTYALGFSGGSPTTPAAGYFVVTGGGTANTAYITDCGAGYGSTPTVSFPGAGGSGAAATATLGTSTCALGIPATGSYWVNASCTGLTTKIAIVTGTAATNTSTTLAGGSVIPSGYHCVQTVCGRSFPDSSFMTDSNGSHAVVYSTLLSGVWWGCYIGGSSVAIKYLIHSTSGVLDITWSTAAGGAPGSGTCPGVATGNPTSTSGGGFQSASVSPTSTSCNDCAVSPTITYTLPATNGTGNALPVSGTVTFTP